MSDNVAERFPEIEFTQPCSICPHMRRISLEKIRDSLAEMSGHIEVDPAVADGARRSVERMLEVSR